VTSVRTSLEYKAKDLAFITKAKAKDTSFMFKAPFGRLRGNVRCSS